VRPRDSSKESALEAESADPAHGIDIAGTAALSGVPAAIVPSATVAPALARESAVVRSSEKQLVGVPAARTSAEGLVGTSRASRVIAIGPPEASASLPTGRRSPQWQSGPLHANRSSGTRPDEDEATVVDGSREPLTNEQHAALARRIRTALESTLPMGTPSPAPVQPNANEAHANRQPRFNQTMLIGLPAPSPTKPPALRASFVRDVGPPKTPPPRRNRRSSGAFDAELGDVDELDDVSDLLERESEPPDHEAFELDHPIVAPELAGWDEAHRPDASRAGVGELRAQQREVGSSAYGGPALILPPPPGALDFEPTLTPETHEHPQRLQGGVIEWPPRVVDQQRQPSLSVPPSSPLARPPRRAPLLNELPSADPFAGFSAPPVSAAQRWATVIVVALAVVGLFSLAAIAFGLLGKTGW
jgi:hypothetical protein